MECQAGKNGCACGFSEEGGCGSNNGKGWNAFASGLSNLPGKEVGAQTFSSEVFIARYSV